VFRTQTHASEDGRERGILGLYGILAFYGKRRDLPRLLRMLAFLQRDLARLQIVLPKTQIVLARLLRGLSKLQILAALLQIVLAFLLIIGL